MDTHGHTQTQRDRQKFTRKDRCGMDVCLKTGGCMPKAQVWDGWALGIHTIHAHCNTLQHTATHCNTPHRYDAYAQHTPTDWVDMMYVHTCDACAYLTCAYMRCMRIHVMHAHTCDACAYMRCMRIHTKP